MCQNRRYNDKTTNQNKTSIKNLRDIGTYVIHKAAPWKTKRNWICPYHEFGFKKKDLWSL